MRKKYYKYKDILMYFKSYKRSLWKKNIISSRNREILEKK